MPILGVPPKAQAVKVRMLKCDGAALQDVESLTARSCMDGKDGKEHLGSSR